MAAPKFSTSVEIAATDSASSTIRKVGRELRALGRGIKTWLGGEMDRAGIDGAGAFARIGAGAKYAFNGVTSVGGAFRVAKDAAGAMFTATKAGLFGAAGIVGGLALAAKAVHGLVDEFVQAGDEIGASSVKLGIGVEALQELRFAAEASDVATSALDGGVSKLNANLGKMKNGGGGNLAAYLKKSTDGKALLGQLKSAKSTEQAFGTIVEALARIPDIGQRTALATAAFGGAGKELVKLGDGGAKAIGALRTEAQKYGVMSQDMIDQAGELDDENRRLGMSWKSLKYTIASELAPYVLDITRGFREYITANKGVIALKTVETIRAVGRGLKVAWEWSKRAFDYISNWVRTTDWESVKRSIGEVWASIRTAGEWIKKGVDAVGGWRNALLLLGGTMVLGTLTRLGLALASVVQGAGAAGAAVSAVTGAGAGVAGAGTAGAGTAAAAGSSVLATGAAVAAVAAFIAWGVSQKDSITREREQRAAGIEGDRLALEGGVGKSQTFAESSAARLASSPDYAQADPWAAMIALGRAKPAASARKPMMALPSAPTVRERGAYQAPSTEEILRRIDAGRAEPQKLDLNIMIEAPPGVTTQATATAKSGSAVRANVGRRSVGVAP
jgi:hypothetical protein